LLPIDEVNGELTAGQQQPAALFVVDPILRAARKSGTGGEKSPCSLRSAEADNMPERGDSTIKIVSEEQAHALARAAIDYELEKDRDRPAVRLAARVSAILKADFVIVAGGDCSWSVLGAGPVQQPFMSADALALFDALESGVAAVRRVGAEDWTLLTYGGDVRVGLAVEGDWTLSPVPLFKLASVVTARVARARGARPASETVARLHYRMMHRLARVTGLLRVSETILRYAASAVDARLGALAVAQAGDNRASIVATHGYPRALVEHVRIEPGAGVIGSVIASRRPVHASGADEEVGRPRRPRYHTSSFIAVPILGGRDVLGAICVTDKKGDRAFDESDVAVLRTFAAGAALALDRERATDSAEAYAHAAAVDTVTGVFNRRYFQVRLDEELQRSRRHQIPLALLLIDVDDFKHVNDSHGHLAGDTVLRDIGEILRHSVRIFDVCARFGGEEFVIIMPGSSSDNAQRIAERIREHIEAYRPSDRVLGGLRVTVSIGLAVSSSGSTASQLLERADRALYAAKHAGKNCIRGDEETDAEDL
jgi:diguanylate cyclase (GGDEF)-like protein